MLGKEGKFVRTVYDSTISVSNHLNPVLSTICSGGFNCDGSELPDLMFHAVSSASHDAAWTSSTYQVFPYYMGKSGYFAHDMASHSTIRPNDMQIHQRPALMI